MKLVLDTNVLVSGVLSQGTCRRILKMGPDGLVTFMLSPEISREYQRVLLYSKFHLSPDQVDNILQKDLLPFSSVIHPKAGTLPFPPSDPDDFMFLHAALAAKADILISGDRHLLELDGKYPFPILTARTFLEERFSK